MLTYLFKAHIRSLNCSCFEGFLQSVPHIGAILQIFMSSSITSLLFSESLNLFFLCFNFLFHPHIFSSADFFFLCCLMWLFSDDTVWQKAVTELSVSDLPRPLHFYSLPCDHFPWDAHGKLWISLTLKFHSKCFQQMNMLIWFHKYINRSEKMCWEMWDITAISVLAFKHFGFICNNRIMTSQLRFMPKSKKSREVSALGKMFCSRILIKSLNMSELGCHAPPWF